MSGSFISVGKEVLLHSESESEPIASFAPHKDETNCAVFNHNAHVFASGGSDGALALYHIERQINMMSLAEADSTVG